MLTALVALVTLAWQAKQARRTRRKEGWWRRVEWPSRVYSTPTRSSALCLSKPLRCYDEQTFLNSVARATEEQARQRDAAQNELVTAAAGELSNRARVLKEGGTAVLTRAYRRGLFGKVLSAGSTVQILRVWKGW